VSYDSGRERLPRTEVIGGKPRSVIRGQTTHQSQTSRNTNARKTPMIIRASHGRECYRPGFRDPVDSYRLVARQYDGASLKRDMHPVLRHRRCGDGFLDVLDAKGSAYRRIAHIPTVSGARTSLFVPELGEAARCGKQRQPYRAGTRSCEQKTTHTMVPVRNSIRRSPLSRRQARPARTEKIHSVMKKISGAVDGRFLTPPQFGTVFRLIRSKTIG
jgi:hypothetical protein